MDAHALDMQHPDSWNPLEWPSTETQTGGLFKAGSFPQWPKAWPLPSPNNGPHPIESEAINATDQNYSEHKNARNDWVNPGKNHKTTNNWND